VGRDTAEPFPFDRLRMSGRCSVYKNLCVLCVSAVNNSFLFFVFLNQGVSRVVMNGLEVL